MNRILMQGNSKRNAWLVVNFRQSKIGDMSHCYMKFPCKLTTNHK